MHISTIIRSLKRHNVAYHFLTSFGFDVHKFSSFVTKLVFRNMHMIDHELICLNFVNITIIGIDDQFLVF